MLELFGGPGVGPQWETELCSDPIKVVGERVQPPIQRTMLSIHVVPEPNTTPLVATPVSGLLWNFLADHRDVGRVPLAMDLVVLGDQGAIELHDPLIGEED